MIEIELNNVKKNYGLKNVLDGFDLIVKTGGRVSLIGQNGCGKSTVLKLIASVESVDSGTINIKKGASIGLLNQIYENEPKDVLVNDYLLDSFQEILKLENELHYLEEKMANEVETNILESLLKKYGKLQEKFGLLGGYEIQEKFKKICSTFKIHQEMLSQNYNDLSGGEKTKINLAKLLLKNPDILLLDEPTNHLDLDSLIFLEDFITSYKGTVLLVSHDRFFLDKVVTKTVLLENGKAEVYEGNYSYFVKEDERRTLAKFENYKNQQKQIEKMKEAIQTLRKFGELAKNEMFFKRAKSIEKRLEKMEVLEKVSINPKSINLNFQIQNRSGKDVLVVKNLSKSYAEKKIFEDVNMVVSYGEKVALVGNNGTGKTTFLKMILGVEKDFEGTIEIGPSVKLGYIPQNIIFENVSQTVLDYFLENSMQTVSQARSILAKYGFRGDDVFKRIGTLSGGEKVRLILMKLMQQDINFLILDEPTNHIDIDTRELLEDALSQYKGTVLFISHDRYFIRKVASRVVKIEEFKMIPYDTNR